MPSLLEDNTDYWLYFMESEAATNTDWIGAQSGNPGKADLSLYTDGVEILWLKLVNQNQDAENYGHTFEPITDGKTEHYTIGEEANLYTARGIYHATTLLALYAKREKVKQFCKRHNRNSAKQAYLVNRYGAAYYEKFFDEDFTELKYARGYVVRQVTTYNEGKLDLNVVIVWRIAWT